MIGIGLAITIPRVVPAAPSFDPLSLSPALFLSPAGPFYSDLGTTQVTTDGSPVRRWADISGNGRHADAPNDSSRPTLRVSGGKTWLDFDGVDDQLHLSSSFLTGYSALYCAYRARPTLLTGGSFGDRLAVTCEGGSAGNWVFVSGFRNGNSWGEVGGSSFRNTTGGAATVNNWLTQSLTVNGNTSVTTRMNGVDGTPGTPSGWPPSTVSPIRIGGSSDSGRIFVGQIASVFLRLTLLAGGEVSSLASYLGGIAP